MLYFRFGRKTNWSLMVSDGMAGFNYLLTTIFSAMRDKTGVTEIGRKSPKDVGVATFGTGETNAIFQLA